MEFQFRKKHFGAQYRKGIWIWIQGPRDGLRILLLHSSNDFWNVILAAGNSFSTLLLEFGLLIASLQLDSGLS